MSNHPFAASASSVGMGPSLADSKSKTIADLPLALREEGVQLERLMIPTEYHDPLKKNYHLTVAQIVALVNLVSLGLDKVDNVPDEDKPISKAVREALEGKLNANHVFRVSVNDITDLGLTLANYRDKNTNIQINEVQDLATVIRDLSPSNHSHSANEPWLAQILGTLSERGHRHAVSDLDGWSMFLSTLNEELARRPSVNNIESVVNDLLDERNLLEVVENNWR